jgi:hypothetical protein
MGFFILRILKVLISRDLKEMQRILLFNYCITKQAKKGEQFGYTTMSKIKKTACRKTTGGNLL